MIEVHIKKKKIKETRKRVSNVKISKIIRSKNLMLFYKYTAIDSSAMYAMLEKNM